MAHSLTSHGYKCHFKDAVNAHFYCTQCGLVARAIVLTSCCGDSYCDKCFTEVVQQQQPCHACHKKEFSSITGVKYRREMEALQVYCSLKERGCDWSGSLGELDAHLDPDLDNCQYVDVLCSLSCPQAVPKNKMEQHLLGECIKREHTCHHCGFKATYEDVVDTHLPECKYVPIQCPNFCGVTCEREDLEHHMKMCRLQEVSCEFSSVGCDDRFPRELLQDHLRACMQSHLVLTAESMKNDAHGVKQRLAQIEERCGESTGSLELRCKGVELQAQNLEMQLGNKEKILLDQEERLEKLTKLYQTTVKDLIKNTTESLKELEGNFETKFLEEHNQLAALIEIADEHNQELVKIKNTLFGTRKFVLSNFSLEKHKDQPDDWKSVSMYTHPFGYKFCIGIDANGFGPTRDRAMRVELWSMEGEYDEELKWPAVVTITIEMVNQRGGENACHTGRRVTLNRVSGPTSVYAWERIHDTEGFIEHDRLEEFLKDDNLQFAITECTLH